MLTHERAETLHLQISDVEQTLSELGYYTALTSTGPSFDSSQMAGIDETLAKLWDQMIDLCHAITVARYPNEPNKDTLVFRAVTGLS